MIYDLFVNKWPILLVRRDCLDYTLNCFIFVVALFLSLRFLLLKLLWFILFFLVLMFVNLLLEFVHDFIIFWSTLCRC